MVRILKVKRPRFFIGENVKGLLSANKKQAFPMIIDEFEKAGYHIKFKVVNASEYGIPQKRERVFIIGFRDEQDFNSFEFPEPVTLDKKIALKDVLDEKANFDEKWFFSQKAVDGMLKVKHKMNKGRNQDIEQPCNTISSHLAKVSLNSTDPVLLVGERYRRFTPREASSIQSFPNSFKLEAVVDIRQYRAIGNAVPPVLMWHIAKSLSDL
jgi:DNA (cytosine-5)-methyltransferase 1